MKKIILISVLCLVVSMVQAQNKYSIENLKNLSQEELNNYFDKAVKLKNTGGKLTLFGVAGFAGGLVFASSAFNNDWGEGIFGIGYIIGLAGIPTALVGLPILITRSERVSKIKSITSTALNNINIDLNLVCNITR